MGFETTFCRFRKLFSMESEWVMLKECTFRSTSFEFWQTKGNAYVIYHFLLCIRGEPYRDKTKSSLVELLHYKLLKYAQNDSWWKSNLMHCSPHLQQDPRAIRNWLQGQRTTACCEANPHWPKRNYNSGLAPEKTLHLPKDFKGRECLALWKV